MALVPRKNVLAIAALIDVALNAHNGPVAAKALCSRHRLPARHLEPVLQALVRQGILKGVRGPYGGYELAREGRQITADDILRAARTIDDGSDEPIMGSPLVSEIVAPVLAEAEHAFSRVLARISVADLMTNAERSARATRGLRH
jgi:Rrf2 family protein